MPDTTKKALENAAAQLHALIGNANEDDNSLSQQDISKIIDLVDNHDGILFKKDMYRSTPLSNAIRGGNKRLIKALLEHGASSSIFVEGYLPESLVCTLPQASQPPSSVFNHEPPLLHTNHDVLGIIDDALVEYIDTLKLHRLHEAVSDATKAVGSLTSDFIDSHKDSTAGAGNGNGTPNGNSKTFNFFPKTLKVGDVVRRGPRWCYDDQDLYTTGKVKSVDGDYVSVQWNYPNSPIYRYEYEPPSNCALQAVDPTDIMAVPPGQTKPIVVTRKAAFQVGDLVRRAKNGNLRGDLFVDGGDLFVDGKLSFGIVTSIEKKAPPALPVSPTRSQGTAAFGFGGRSSNGSSNGSSNESVPLDEIKVRVIDIDSEKITEYSSDKLDFADGSHRGLCRGSCGSLRGPFELGEEVQLSDDSNRNSAHGVLGNRSEKRIGKIVKVPLCNLGHETNYVVDCSGNNSQYREKDLRRVFKSSSTDAGGNVDSQKFKVGDRVVLSSSFFNTNSDGWNLGSSKDDLKTGVVVFAAPKDQSSSEQRSIMVVSEDPNDAYKQQPFAFQESWLDFCVAGENCTHHKFKRGDRVKLNTAIWRTCSPETGGKNLGTPTENQYGVVISTGCLRDGIQRNVQVVAISDDVSIDRAGDEKNEILPPLVSLYPSYSLLPITTISASNLDTAEDSDGRSHLLEACGKVVSKAGIEVDIEFLCNRFSANIWASLWGIVRSKGVSFDEFMAVWETWYNSRPAKSRAFDVTKEKEILQNLKNYEIKEVSSDYDEWKQEMEEVPNRNIDCDVSQWLPDVEKETEWICSQCKVSNLIGKGTCTACRHKPGGWKCEGCNRINKVATTVCEACNCSAERSKAIRSVCAYKEKKRREEKELYEFIENHYSMEKDMERSFSLNSSSGSSILQHVGSYSGCGGNPDGYCNTSKAALGKYLEGVCTTEGPDKCRDCGRNTHWSCCGKTDKEDMSCGADQAQAKKNASAFSTKNEFSGVPRCKDMPGVIFPGLAPTDWACMSCSTLNAYDLGECSVCKGVPLRLDKRYTAMFATDGALSNLGVQQKAGRSGRASRGKSKGGTAKDVDVCSAIAGTDIIEKARCLPPRHLRLCEDSSKCSARMSVERAPVAVIGSVPFPASSTAESEEKEENEKKEDDEVTPQRCAMGHPMSKRSDTLDSNFCYICTKMLPAGSNIYECEICEVNKCAKCAKCAGPGRCNVGWAFSSAWDGEIDDDEVDSLDTGLTNNDSTTGTSPEAKSSIDAHFEMNKNRLKLEELSYGVVGVQEEITPDSPGGSSVSSGSLGPPLRDTSDDSNDFNLGRQSSAGFADLASYQPITQLDHLVNYKDKAFNTAMHHAAFIGLPKFLSEMQEYAKSPPLNKSSYIYNAAKVVPLALLDGVATIYPSTILENNGGNLSDSEYDMEAQNTLNLAVPVRGVNPLPLYAFDAEGAKLYRAVRRRHLGQKNMSAKIIRSIFRTPRDYSWPPELGDLVDAIMDIDKEKSMELSTNAINSNVLHAHAYKAVALIDCGFGFRSAQEELNMYFAQIENDEIEMFDPIAFFAIYSIWKDQNQPFKLMRLCASDTLQCLRCFPKMAESFITSEDDVDLKVKKEGIDNDNEDNDEDDEDAVVLELKPDDPEFKWKKAKEDKGMKSPSMDKLMNLTGMKEIKNVAISVCMDALSARDRPKHIKADRSMNFLFVGNPGTGKTTVAELLSSAMVELGFRKNPKPILTSANDILSEQDPAEVFKQMIEEAGNGTIFIDEAYHFNPAPKGSTANASNKVLDLLMKVSETKRESLSFILAGYKQEILELMQYNPGFPSRFPRTLEFSDYTESQLQQIMVDFAMQKGMKFQSKKECGVPIAKILARRLGKGAGKKGFGNAREVRNRVDRCVEEQTNRLGTMKLYGKPVTAKDYSMLTRADTIGLRPDFDSSPILKELDMMIGLGSIKTAVRALMNLQMQNYDNELRGEKVQYISLHRVFMGNAGTGKTTVARLYGRLLKEFGFLSDGDIVEVKPSDLKGQSVGEAAQTTKKVIDMAKGKVLFIDEAYGLDPTRGIGGSYGGDVLDTIVEQIEGSSGQDIAVIMAGYKHEMSEMFKNSGNQGLIRRFNLDDAFFFEDFSDEDLKKVMLYGVRKEALKIDPDTLDAAVKLIAQKRRLDGFGNAAEANTSLNRAKLRLAQRKATAAANADRCRLAEKTDTSPSPTAIKTRIGGGALQSINSFSNDDPLPTPEECFCDPHLLIKDDFIIEETSVEKAKDAILDLENVDHVMQFILDVEDTLEDAKSQDKSIADILDTCHMIFTGPPGTGKTTVAQRMGVMFKQLELLPRSDIEMVTASSLMGAYVGHTEKNVMEAMKRAKGGILFIDEAYGFVSGKGTFGQQAVQTLMENITAPEFKGNLLVILAGYADKIDALFDVNPGFRSRFDKKRLEFPSWTPEMATNAIIKKVDKDGLIIEDEAKEILPILFRSLASLPDWGSARDVYETIYTAMYGKRASRVGQLARLKRAEAEAKGGSQSPAKPTTGKSRRQLASEKNKRPDAAPYVAADIQAAFEDPIKRRSKNQVDSSSVLADSNKHESRLINISSKQELNSLCASLALTVVCYSQSGGITQDISQELGKLSSEYGKVNFAYVDGHEMHELLEEAGITKMPSICLYMDGRNCDRCIAGYDEKELRQKIQKYSRLSISSTSLKLDEKGNVRKGGGGEHQSSSDRDNDDKNGDDDDDDLFATQDPDVKDNIETVVKTEVKHKIFGEDDDGSGADWTDWNTLLEEACGELGYSFEEMENFLESGNYPEQLVALVMSMAGLDDKPTAVEGMNTQRTQFLAKVKLALKEKAKAKSEAEAKIQAKVQSIGRCPMGFAWDKVDGGWRCQGGSHFVDNASVNRVSD